MDKASLKLSQDSAEVVMSIGLGSWPETLDVQHAKSPVKDVRIALQLVKES